MPFIGKGLKQNILPRAHLCYWVDKILHKIVRVPNKWISIGCSVSFSFCYCTFAYVHPRARNANNTLYSFASISSWQQWMSFENEGMQNWERQPEKKVLEITFTFRKKLQQKDEKISLQTLKEQTCNVGCRIKEKCLFFMVCWRNIAVRRNNNMNNE
jgi:hypothetical protein